MHLNPNVQKSVYELLTDIPNIYLISPLDYLLFVYMMQLFCLILTDSGGAGRSSVIGQTRSRDARYD
ncbi:hypothetical protein AGMMS50239_27270 [Bacteroidia bacterium]|nr:hypothetical protein AGMMS50239_27270 [Bacteroidia bacterium]